MAQWKHQFSGHTHTSRVEDRRAILSNAIATWNAVAPENRTPQMRKKLLRLADNLLSAMTKEKQAYLDRTVLDKRSSSYVTKAEEIKTLQESGVDGILRSMQAAEWRDTIDEQSHAPRPANGSSIMDAVARGLGDGKH